MLAPQISWMGATLERMVSIKPLREFVTMEGLEMRNLVLCHVVVGMQWNGQGSGGAVMGDGLGIGMCVALHSRERKPEYKV